MCAYSCDQRTKILVGASPKKVPKFRIRKGRDSANCNGHHEEPGRHHAAAHSEGKIRTQAHQRQAAGNKFPAQDTVLRSCHEKSSSWTNATEVD